jgi:hypothetical protein
MITPRVFACVFVLSAVAALASEPVLKWETKGFEAPESVVFDAAKTVYYVSNMGTYGAGEKPHDGFVSRVGEDGTLIEAHWVGGLDNPKGLALSNGHLFVGDDVYLTEIDVAAGKIVGQYKPEDGPGDFNDCTADAEGNVYVCSGRLGTVFRLHAGKFEPWVKLDTKATGGINGLRAEGERLLLGGWSLGRADGTEEVGHLSSIDYRSKTVARIGTTPICHIDGLEPDGRDGYVISDWLTGEVFHVTAKGEKTLLLKLGQGAADMLYRQDVHLLLVPLMKEHCLRAYAWKL